MRFMDMQRELGIDYDLRGIVSQFRVLRFDLDRVGDKVVSKIDNEIVFIDRRWEGDRPKVGEIWVCRVTHPGTVYVAEPLVRVDPSFLMGLGESQRREIMDTLWKDHSDLFENEFERRYHDSVLIEAKEQLQAEHDGEIDGLKARISSLETQLDQSLMMLNSRSQGGETDEPSEAINGIQRAAHIEVMSDGSPSSVSRISGSHGFTQYEVNRVGPNMLFSDSFTDGRYSVHISPNRRFMTVREDPNGPVIAVNNHLHLRGLDGISSYVREERMFAEYSEKYDGMLIDFR